ncbi:hypothetical protein BDZ97DRAFT_1925891 [Flammula alnicola]|nr:hypothetical protein BDZ97DRAFT_1925891 [Flammula alnicola]
MPTPPNTAVSSATAAHGMRPRGRGSSNTALLLGYDGDGEVRAAAPVVLLLFVYGDDSEVGAQQHGRCCLDTTRARSEEQQYDHCCCSDITAKTRWEQQQQHDCRCSDTTSTRPTKKGEGDEGEGGDDPAPPPRAPASCPRRCHVPTTPALVRQVLAPHETPRNDHATLHPS